MTLEELRKRYKAMSTEAKRALLLSLGFISVRKKVDTKDLENVEEWIENLSPEQVNAIAEQIDKAALYDENTRGVNEAAYLRTFETTAEELDLDKNRLADTYIRVTGQPLPGALESKLIAAESYDDLRLVLQEMMQGDQGDAIGDAYMERVRSDQGVLREKGEGVFLEPVPGQPGKMRNTETGEIVDSPLSARAGGAGGISDEGIPPLPTEETRHLIGRPPEGFVAGVGTAPETTGDEQIDRINQEAFDQQQAAAYERAARIQREKYQDLDTGRGSLLQGADPFDPNAEQFQVTSRYYEGDEWQFVWKGATYIRLIQEQMEAGGLLKPGTYAPGLWDTKTNISMQTLMGEGNASGRTWDKQLAERMAAYTPDMLSDLYGSGGAKRAPFVAPAHRAPDYASLSQAVKGLTRQRLKREPTDRDMATLSAQMDSDYRKQYEAEVAALRSEYDATTRAIDSESAQSGGTVRMVDPSSRFQEAFERKYAGEISLNEDSDDFIATTSKAQGAMGRFDAMIGH